MTMIYQARVQDKHHVFGYLLFFSICRLKSQQGLLVDFCAFPQKFVDLLELCRGGEQRDSPK